MAKPYEKHTHATGGIISPTYRVWKQMRGRCGNPNNPDYRHYGGRGIFVCDRWQNSFGNFLADMGERPDGMQIDRIDNDCGYSPENCRWVGRDIQMQNTRATRLITFRGKTMGLGAWARTVGISISGLASRLQRMSVEDALTSTFLTFENGKRVPSPLKPVEPQP